MTAASAASTPTPPDLAEVIAATVLATPGVAGLHGGSYGHVATYLPGRAVTGVRTRDDSTAVNVTVRWGAPVLQIADDIRARVQPLVGHRVDVSIEDVVGPASDPLAAKE